MKILMAIPNISEGRNPKVIDDVAEAIKSVAGVRFLGTAPDEDHNRTVFSYLGEPEAVLAATKLMAEATFALVDMTKQTGAHPRMGALDVAPFVPIKGVEMSEAVGIARQFGKWVGDRGIPVYYYEEAATSPQRINLAEVRKGQYEGLKEKLADPAWAPDEGPAQFVPRTGAVLTCARMPLVAFNVNLWTENVQIAKKIAEAVRYIGGGYRYVRAMGLALEGTGMVQVSMNLINYIKTPIPRVLETIKSEADRYGVAVAGTELIGLMPSKAVEEIMRFYVRCHDFTSDQLIEMNCLPE